MKSGLHREKIMVTPLKNGKFWADCYYVCQLPGYDEEQCKTEAHYSTLIRKAN